MKVLVTAFEPFGGEARNASLEVLRELPKEFAGWELVRQLLPVTFECEAQLYGAIRAHSPDAVLCMGQAAGSKTLRFEKIAVNIKNSRQADNAGQVFRDTPISPTEGLTLPSSLPLEQMTAAADTPELPAEISYHAGTFVCNYTFYRLMEGFGVFHPAGFLHLPLADVQQGAHPGQPCFPAAQMAKQVVSALTVLAETVIE